MLGTDTMGGVARAGRPFGLYLLEDLECDSKTFPGKGGIWNQRSGDRVTNAWEIPLGHCYAGGLTHLVGGSQ